MSDMDIVTAIHNNLTGYVKSGDSSPYFSKVFKGPTEGLTPMDKTAAWTYRREDVPPEGAKTMGTTMRLDVFEVKCFWLRRGMEESRENLEDDVYVVSHGLPGVFWADATLGGYVSDVDVVNKRFGLEAFPELSENYYRTLTFELLVKVLEGEAISA